MKKVHIIETVKWKKTLCGIKVEGKPPKTPLYVPPAFLPAVKSEYLCKRCRRKYNLSKAGKGMFK
jgi:hypothetical protein